VKPDDIANVYERAVEALIERLERVRFGARAKPRKGGRRSKNGTRYVSRDVKRAVWTRDGGQCTYTSESGRRCEARKDLQYDHVTEFARGGEATVDNIRLRCPGHNQHAAEQTFGAGFMKQKREGAAAARAAVKAARARDLAGKAAEAERARLLPHQLEVIPWLEQLGCRKDESRVAVERCRDMADAPLEQRVKRSLAWFGARLGRKVLPAAAAASDPPSPADPPA
jgi:5-methylcytosine-specific restriction endonuclease McrA